jgi:hypothetical protein
LKSRSHRLTAQTKPTHIGIVRFTGEHRSRLLTLLY